MIKTEKSITSRESIVDALGCTYEPTDSQWYLRFTLQGIDMSISTRGTTHTIAVYKGFRDSGVTVNRYESSRLMDETTMSIGVSATRTAAVIAIDVMRRFDLVAIRKWLDMRRSEDEVAVKQRADLADYATSLARTAGVSERNHGEYCTIDIRGHWYSTDHLVKVSSSGVDINIRSIENPELAHKIMIILSEYRK